MFIISLAVVVFVDPAIYSILLLQLISFYVFPLLGIKSNGHHFFLINVDNNHNNKNNIFDPSILFNSLSRSPIFNDLNMWKMASMPPAYGKFISQLEFGNYYVFILDFGVFLVCLSASLCCCCGRCSCRCCSLRCRNVNKFQLNLVHPIEGKKNILFHKFHGIVVIIPSIHVYTYMYIHTCGVHAYVCWNFSLWQVER